MAAFIELIENTQIEFERAYKKYQILMEAADQPVQIFLICEVNNNNQDISKLKAVNPYINPVIYTVSFHCNLIEFEKQVDEIVADIAAQVNGEAYYVLENEHDTIGTMVLLKLIEGLPDKLHFTSTDIDRSQLAVYDFAEESELTLEERLFYNYLEQFNYVAIYSMIKQNKIPRTLENQVRQLIKFRDFNFDEYMKLQLMKYRKNIEKYPDLKIYKPVLEEMMQLCKYEQVPFIKALYFNSRIEFTQSDFIDFLVRYLRLVEELLVFVLGWDITPTGKLVFKHKKNKRSSPPQIKNLSRLTRAFNKMPGLIKKYPEFHQYINSRKVKALVDLRHSSVAGHGFEEVSRDALSQIYKGDIILQLHQIIQSLGINLDYDYYEVLNAFLIADFKLNPPL